MLFKIFGKVQNYAKTIVRPNGPKQSWVAGHQPVRPYRNTTSMDERVQYPKCAYDLYRICIGLREWDGKEWEVQKINRENESYGQKNQGLNIPEFHSSA